MLSREGEGWGCDPEASVSSRLRPAHQPQNVADRVLRRDARGEPRAAAFPHEGLVYDRLSVPTQFARLLVVDCSKR
jgi:hypothetical protein